MVKHAQMEDHLIKCVRCSRELKAHRFKLYYYQPQKRGMPVGEKERRRILNCKDCVKEMNVDHDENGKRCKKLTVSNLESLTHNND